MSGAKSGEQVWCQVWCEHRCGHRSRTHRPLLPGPRRLGSVLGQSSDRPRRGVVDMRASSLQMQAACSPWASSEVGERTQTSVSGSRRADYFARCRRRALDRFNSGENRFAPTKKKKSGGAAVLLSDGIFIT
ncbi:hypothetical protein MRX96_031978 [Rhipicephalus microplus]